MGIPLITTGSHKWGFPLITTGSHSSILTHEMFQYHKNFANFTNTKHFQTVLCKLNFHLIKSYIFFFNKLFVSLKCDCLLFPELQTFLQGKNK